MGLSSIKRALKIDLVCFLTQNSIDGDVEFLRLHNFERTTAPNILYHPKTSSPCPAATDLSRRGSQALKEDKV